MRRFGFYLLILCFSAISNANSYYLANDGSSIVGENTYYIVKKGDTLQKIADKFNVGFLALYDLNPDIDTFLPEPGSRMIIPTKIVLPDVKHEGIVINIAELRLYRFLKNKVYIFPVGIGTIGRETPTMITKVASKRANPTWTPPTSIRIAHKAQGDILPKVVPAGPDNPLGKYALRLGYGHGEYLIHGTNKDFGIGLRVSAGCIRLRADNIKWIFENTKRGTAVRIINQPIKIARLEDKSTWIEVHTPLSTDSSLKYKRNFATLTIKQKKSLDKENINAIALNSALFRQAGFPAKISFNKIDLLNIF